MQRPNAVTQLGVVAEQAGVAIFAPEPGNGVGNPVQVATAGVAHAREKLHDFVIIDTAGRLGVDEELMRQAADIRKATNPDEVLFVIDSMIGQDAVATAQAFQKGVDFTGVVLTKLDGDARGGAALSIRGVTGKPILFASTGETLDDFEIFHPDRMASRILDLGDVLTLIEQAQAAFDEEEARKTAEKIANEQFTLDDFLKQMQQLRGQGSLKKMMGMLPGMGKMKEQLDNFDERKILHTEAIIQSMTPAERKNPKLLNGSRRLRIAKGSGMTVTDVNMLVKQFEQAAKMMRTVARGGMPQLPGMPGGAMPAIPGMHGGKKKQAQGKKKGARKSGNPAKRASGAPLGVSPTAGSALGLGTANTVAPSTPSAADMQQMQALLESAKLR